MLRHPWITVAHILGCLIWAVVSILFQFRCPLISLSRWTKQSHNFQHSLQLKRGWQLVHQQAIKSNWHTTSDALDKQHSTEWMTSGGCGQPGEWLWWGGGCEGWKQWAQFKSLLPAQMVRIRSICPLPLHFYYRHMMAFSNNNTTGHSFHLHTLRIPSTAFPHFCNGPVDRLEWKSPFWSENRKWILNLMPNKYTQELEESACVTEHWYLLKPKE